MRRPEARDVAVWTISIGGLICYDVWATDNRPQGTLTCLLKWLTHAETRAGKVVVISAYAALGAWGIPHLSEKAVEVVHALTEPIEESTP